MRKVVVKRIAARWITTKIPTRQRHWAVFYAATHAVHSRADVYLFGSGGRDEGYVECGVGVRDYCFIACRWPKFCTAVNCWFKP